MKKEIFRQYDIRGIVETDLTEKDIHDLAYAFAVYFSKNGCKNILIGYDNRISSKPINDILVSELTKYGLNITNIGLVITPMFYFAAKMNNFNAGIMITASHNSGEYNGFKVYLGDSTIYGDEIQSIFEIAQHKEIENFCSKEKLNTITKGNIEETDIYPSFKKYLLDHISLGPRKLRIGLDCGNGTASLFATDILSSAGVDVTPIYCDSDPTFPNHFPDPVKLENCKDLSNLVINNNLDLGIGFDGDGDRVGVIDENGNPIWGDMLMVILSREIIAKHPGSTIICEVKCSQLLPEDIEKNGGKAIIYKTGHSLIKAKMKETNAICAGEMSGHIFLKDEYFGYDDAIYAALRILRILSNTDKKMSELLSTLPKTYSTPEIRVKVTEESKNEIVEKAKQYLKKSYDCLTIDGVRAIIKDGWGLIRASNTGPVLVMRAEAKTPETLQFIKKELEKAIQ